MLLPWIYSYVEDSIKTLMDGIQQKINKPSHQSSYSDRKAHHFDLKTHHSIRHLHQEEKSFSSSFNRLRMKNKRLLDVYKRQTHTGSCLAGVKHTGICTFQHLCIFTGHCCNTAHTLHHVQHQAFGLKQRLHLSLIHI